MGRGRGGVRVIYTCSHVKYINYTCSNYTKLKNAPWAASFHKIYFIQSVVGSALFWRCPPPPPHILGASTAYMHGFHGCLLNCLYLLFHKGILCNFLYNDIYIGSLCFRRLHHFHMENYRMGALKQIKQFQLQIATDFPFTYFEKVLIFQYILFYKELVKTEGCISMHLSLL